MPFLYYFVPCRINSVDVFCCFFNAILSPFVVFYTFFYAFLLQNQIYAHFLGWNYRKNYRKPINWHFSNYRQKYRYRFKTSSNYRWFEEIIDKVIDIEIVSKIIEKLSLSEKMTYRTPLPLGHKVWALTETLIGYPSFHHLHWRPQGSQQNITRMSFPLESYENVVWYPSTTNKTHQNISILTNILGLKSEDHSKGEYFCQIINEINRYLMKGAEHWTVPLC